MRWPLGRAWAGGRPAETSTARAGERGAKTSDAATRARATSAGRATSLRSARSIPLPSLVRGVTMGQMRAKALLLATALALALPAVASAAAAFRLTSPAFRSGGAIPKRFSCDGADVSPPLRWTAPPRRTRSLALVFEDTSTAPPFMHWLAWGVAPRVRGLIAAARLTLEGRNDFGRTGYGGPCPPSGTKHPYVFPVYPPP